MYFCTERDNSSLLRLSKSASASSPDSRRNDTALRRTVSGFGASNLLSSNYCLGRSVYEPDLPISVRITRHNRSGRIRHARCRFNELRRWDHLSRVLMRIGVSPLWKRSVVYFCFGSVSSDQQSGRWSYRHAKREGCGRGPGFRSCAV